MSAEQDNVALATTVTGTHLLEELRDPANQIAWQQFVGRYRPLLLSYARGSFGLRADEAEDAAQIALAAFCEAYADGQYDPDRGRLRKWMFGIATNRFKQFVRGKAGNREVQIADASDATAFLAGIPDDGRLEERWEAEWRRAILRQCMEEIRFQFDARTVEAFELYVSRGWPARRVAAALETSENAVYLARHHILKRIRELVPRIEKIW